MKRKMIVYSSILIGIVFLCCISTIIKDFDSKELKTETEIIKIFKDNKESFSNVVSELIDFHYHWSIQMRGFDKKLRPDWKGMDLKSGIKLVVKEQAFFDEILFIQNKIEDNKNVEEVIKELKFCFITNNAAVDKKSIYFIQQNMKGYSRGIVYCREGIPQNPYIVKLTQIEPLWFYFEER